MRDIFDLGPAIAELRKAADLRQVDVAARAGVNVKSMSEYEKGTVVPSTKTLQRIATVLPLQMEEWAEPLRIYHSHKRYSRQAEELRASMAPKPKRTSTSVLGDICRAARAAGMTYGDFVATHTAAEIW